MKDNKMIECVVCGVTFDPYSLRHKRKGKFNECEQCADDDVNHSIGILVVNGKTDYHVEVIEKPSQALAKLIKKQQLCGPTQCHSSLGLNTNGSSTPKDKIDKVQESLKIESEQETKSQQFKN